MRVHKKHHHRWLSTLAFLLLVGGLVLEIHDHGEENRAKSSLGGALREVSIPESAGERIPAQLNEVDAHVRYGRHLEAARGLDRIAGQVPTPSFHALAARAYRAAGDARTAARHWQLAASLAPEDEQLASAARASIDRALLAGLLPGARIGLGLAALWFVFLFVHRGHARARERRTREWLEQLRGRLSFSVDGTSGVSRPVLHPDTESLAIDLFLSGRYGFALPTAPRWGSTLTLSLSHAGSSRTVRLTPVRNVRSDAVRVPLKDTSLDQVIDRAGTWRVTARLGDRVVALGDLTVTHAPLAVPV